MYHNISVFNVPADEEGLSFGLFDIQTQKQANTMSQQPPSCLHSENFLLLFLDLKDSKLLNHLLAVLFLMDRFIYFVVLTLFCVFFNENAVLHQIKDLTFPKM